MPERQQFVIVSLPRTGSTYLVDYLDAIDGVRCLSEIFHPNEIMLRHHRTNDPLLMDIAVRDADQMAYLDRLEKEIGDCGWFGFKHFPRHGLKLLQHMCASRQWRKIFLWRDNLLEQYLSFLIASAHFGKVTWGRVPNEVRLTVPLTMLMDDIHTIERNYIAIEEALMLSDPRDVFTLDYDDLGRPAVMRALLGFLGLPEARIDRVVAQTTGGSNGAELKFERGPTPAQRIVNYDEIRWLLLRSRYRRWVEEAREPALAGRMGA